jgi:hypothetical protein
MPVERCEHTLDDGEDNLAFGSLRSRYHHQSDGYVDKHRSARLAARESYKVLEAMWRRPSPQQVARSIIPPLSASEFKALAEEWRRDTRHVSSITKKVMHPAYQRIMAMGEAALPLILQDLQATRSHWLWALHYITRKDPADPAANFHQAVDAWLRWGRENGLLSR